MLVLAQGVAGAFIFPESLSSGLTFVTFLVRGRPHAISSSRASVEAKSIRSPMLPSKKIRLNSD
jgi:hypothetical protein